jgi:N-acetylglucosaminyl-diphospho-decaprenol L-rhamnosyltransferase
LLLVCDLASALASRDGAGVVMASAASTPGSIQIVIVNWNTGDFLRRCLQSIIPAAARPDVDLVGVTVIDNASVDGSAVELGDLDLPLTVVCNRTNVGFAAACDQGAAKSEADYLLFLNPDTELDPEALALLTAFMDHPGNQRVGICGAQVVDPGGAPTISCSRFPTLRVVFGKMTGLSRLLPRLFPEHHLRPEETRASGFVDQVIGAFFFVRRALFDALHGFDTRYFIYFEEVDFSLRAREQGFSSYFLREARVIHHGRVSADQAVDLRIYHSLRSRSLYARHHWPRRQAELLVVLTFAVELPARLLVGLLGGRPNEIRAIASAYRRLLRAMVSAAGLSTIHC